MKQLGPRETAGYAEFAELAPAKPISGRAAYDRYIEHTQTKAHADRNFKGLVGASKPFCFAYGFCLHALYTCDVPPGQWRIRAAGERRRCR